MSKHYCIKCNKSNEKTLNLDNPGFLERNENKCTIIIKALDVVIKSRVACICSSDKDSQGPRATVLPQLIKKV